MMFSGEFSCGLCIVSKTSGGGGGPQAVEWECFSTICSRQNLGNAILTIAKKIFRVPKFFILSELFDRNFCRLATVTYLGWIQGNGRRSREESNLKRQADLLRRRSKIFFSFFKE
jgi:hypothetical protein